MTAPTPAAWVSALFTGELLPAESADANTMPRWDHGDGDVAVDNGTTTTIARKTS